MPALLSSSRRTGYVIALISAAGTGVATVLGKWNLEHLSPLAMNCLIFSTATIIMTIFWLPTKGVRRTFTQSRQGWLWLSLFAVTSALAVWAFWAGVQQMDPSLAAFLNRAEVPLAILTGMIFLRERFTRGEIVGTLVALAGIVIMRATLRVEYSLGFYLVLLGAFFFALTEFLSKIALRHVPATSLAYIRNMFMAVMYWLAFWVGDHSLEGLEHIWPGVIALGFMGPVFNRITYLLALERLELSKVAVIGQMQPVFTVIVAFLTLGLLPTVRETAGGVCLVIGCVLMVLYRTRHPATKLANATETRSR
ncbi:EamA family transporter [candidate division GN15 bacterium]|nr:EamA family transporter [candidate division GN15 bacterium]